MKSALFVDFDNVYSGLRRLDLAYAETFAGDPLRWMNWIARQLPMPLAPEAEVQRRILVRRCYLNPVMYQRFRFGFSKAGFEIVDCPPMTVAGKTSTDIHMVLDIVDVLQSETRYDEFIVFSADADFTPVLRKLRRDDRRTTIFAAGATSASYDASSDLIIDPEAFIREALGFGDDEHPATVAVPDFEGLLAQAEALTWETVDKASAPVMLPALTKILATRIPGLTATNWAGLGTFTALLRELPLSPLRIDRENNWLIDPRRVRNDAALPTQPAATPEAARPRPDAAREPTGRPVAEVRAQITQILLEEVAESARPVAVARLAHRVRQQCPGVELDWLGCGTFKKLLDTLDAPGVSISWASQAGYAFDPARHSLDFIAAPSAAEQAASAQDPRWPQVAPLLQVASLPALSSAQYQAVLASLAQALAEGPFSLSVVTKRGRDLCQEQQQSVARSDINALLRVLLFNGFDPAQAGLSVDTLVASTCGVALAACEREGMTVTDADREALLGWMQGPTALA